MLFPIVHTLYGYGYRSLLKHLDSLGCRRIPVHLCMVAEAMATVSYA
jgi:hypothetical protein